MTYLQVENNLRLCILQVISTDYPDVQVIFANENGPRPPLPYISINILTFTKIGMSSRSMADINGDIIIRTIEDFTVGIQAYGENSREILETFKDKKELQVNLDFICEQGIVIRDDNDIREIAILVDYEREKRYIYEITCGFGKELIDTVGYIGTVEVNGEIETIDGETKNETIIIQE